MKFILLTTLVFFSIQSDAEVGSIWAKNTAIIIVQGPNTDSSKLYELLAVNEIEVQPGDIYIKSLSFQNEHLEVVFNINCRQSRLASATSCTIKIIDGKNSSLQKTDKVATVVITSGNIKELFSAFNNEDYLNEIFRSEKNQLTISLEYNVETREPKIFKLSYSDSGLGL